MRAVYVCMYVQEIYLYQHPEEKAEGDVGAYCACVSMRWVCMRVLVNDDKNNTKENEIREYFKRP